MARRKKQGGSNNEGYIGVEYLNSYNRRKDGDIPKHASKQHPTLESSRNVYQAG
jgi:hypothetical protein